MKITENELFAIKREIQTGLIDPIPNNSLINFISSGSKLIRSTIAILYLKSQNIEISKNIIKILASGEIIHNASLLHDDVLDGADIRRGKSTIAKEFTPKVSILAGDFLLSNAIEKLLELDNSIILEVFQKCTKKMTEAEIRQYFLRGKIPNKQDYIEICEGKTASLFSAIFESCAMISHLSQKHAKTFANIYGICFQIKNDLDETSANTDKRNGILTAKDILGIEKTTILLDNYKEEMRKLIKDFPENVYKNGLEDLINSL